jgi:putative membrane protein
MPAVLLLHVGHDFGLGAWHFEPVAISAFLIASGYYVYRLKDGPVEPYRVVSFFAGALAILLALISPLDTGADRLLSLHMLQHVLITTIGPPLLLLGLPAFMLRPQVRPAVLRRLAGWLTLPFVAAALFTVNMWFWHVPPVYSLALDNLAAHVTMHVAFMATGIIFWWPVIQPLPELTRIGEGARLLYLFVTGFPMGLLALLLLSSGNVVYDHYETVTPLWGISPIEDQQVAGVIMGALGEAAAFIAITFLFFRFLDHEEAAEPARNGSLGAKGRS